MWLTSGNMYYFDQTTCSIITLPETHSSPLKIRFPKRKGSSSNHPFSGAMLVSGRVVWNNYFLKGGFWIQEKRSLFHMLETLKKTVYHPYNFSCIKGHYTTNPNNALPSLYHIPRDCHRFVSSWFKIPVNFWGGRQNER